MSTNNISVIFTHILTTAGFCETFLALLNCYTIYIKTKHKNKPSLDYNSSPAVLPIFLLPLHSKILEFSGPAFFVFSLPHSIVNPPLVFHTFSIEATLVHITTDLHYAFPMASHLTLLPSSV